MKKPAKPTVKPKPKPQVKKDDTRNRGKRTPSKQPCNAMV